MKPPRIISASLRFVALAWLVWWNGNLLGAEEPTGGAIVPTDYLVLPAVGEYGKLPIHRDAVEAQLVAGEWKMPADGDTIDSLDGKSEAWEAATANDAGVLETRDFRGGWATTEVESPSDQVVLLEAAGHATVYVNGEPHAGDPYQLGWLQLPVRVRKGTNTLLFHVAGERLSVRLVTPQRDVFFMEEDRTLPTLVRSDSTSDQVWGAIPIVNTSEKWLNDVAVECRRGDSESVESPAAPVPPLSVSKLAFRLPAAVGDATGETVDYEVRLKRGMNAEEANDDNPPRDEGTMAEADFELKVVGPQDIQVRTFRSRVDGSIQSYAVRPASEAAAGELAGILISLHDTAVSCEGQAARFAAKDWAHVVAPTGRRPYGFDWESWSRIDALEALADARTHYPNDRARTYLTGHSMGGHGAWHLGVTHPHEFAAIGPSSAWVSFWSYGGGMPSYDDPSDIETLLLRGYSASDTLKLLSNLSTTSIYVLHGAADDDVPIEQARFMRERLAEFHPNFVYFEQPGAGHWWGNECCDWPRMLEYFRHAKLPAPEEVNLIDFTTANPGVSSRCHWVSIEAQQEQHTPSRVSMRQNLETRTFVGTTTNVARLAVDVGHLSPNQPIDVTLDGETLQWLPWPGESRKLVFERGDEKWAPAESPSPQQKGPVRYGTFNAVFDHDPLLVYGTSGTDDENRWAAAKARFDAETFWYRANGNLEVIPDSRFDVNRDPDRSVVLYGNMDTNRAWPSLLASCPIEVKRGEVRSGSRVDEGEDLAVMMVRPRSGSDVALVGAVGGTGPMGMRLTNRMRWYVSGIVYPDLMVLGPKTLTNGTADVRGWGYFGLDWQLDDGEFAWRDAEM